MYGRWTFDDKRKMVNDYHRVQSPRCPGDHALLTVVTAGINHTRKAVEPDVLYFTCPACMRSFYSDDVESYPAQGMAQAGSSLAERVVGVI
ncbi:MAG: hypothetical protein M3R24_40445 [Chloroflexota bacterium]|nr:hypothetical protein [Chloroflexota bacterium]